MLLGVDARKSAIFGMAFKMHAATQYHLVDSVTEADVLVVDVDHVEGEALWEKVQSQHAQIPRIYSSVLEPKFDVAYLPKPIKVETLFPVLRAALSGLVTFKVDEANVGSSSRERLSFKDQAKNYKNTLIDEPAPSTAPRDVRFPTEQVHKFDASSGLLGALRSISKQSDNVALLLENKPVLMYFADIDRVLLAISPDKLEHLCQKDAVELSMKKIGDHPEWKQHAKAQMDSCLWQFAIWTAQGRLPNEIDINQLLFLRSWPNITRLAYIPDAMRLSAFLTKAPVNLPIVYRMIRVDIHHLMNFVSACYVTGLLKLKDTVENVQQGVSSAVNIGGVEEATLAKAQVETETKPADTVVTPPPARPKQSSSMLQRLLKKLTGN